MALDRDEVVLLDEDLVAGVELDGVRGRDVDTGLRRAPDPAAPVAQVGTTLRGQLGLVTAGPPESQVMGEISGLTRIV